MSLLTWIIIFCLLGGLLSVLAAALFLVLSESLRNHLLPHLVSFATGALLGLIPLFKAGLEVSDIIVDSKSGISGAGCKGELSLSVVEATESVKAYKVASHRHQPEILSELRKIQDSKLRFTFTVMIPW